MDTTYICIIWRVTPGSTKHQLDPTIILLHTSLIAVTPKTPLLQPYNQRELQKQFAHCYITTPHAGAGVSMPSAEVGVGEYQASGM